MEALDYAISKDVRNNQIVREIDHSRQRDLWRWAWIGSVILALVVYSSWQHFELLRHGYRVEQMERARKQEVEINRHLRLRIQTLKAPQRIAAIATSQLRMVEPTSADAVVLERAVPVEPPSKSIVARR
ncbi:MAG TPA: cell division protein FtsL [Vicinamibacterales bacterium]|nr:cell division protein FtsL [Vicinamibacterales bacterium]